MQQTPGRHMAGTRPSRDHYHAQGHALIAAPLQCAQAQAMVVVLLHGRQRCSQRLGRAAAHDVRGQRNGVSPCVSCVFVLSHQPQRLCLPLHLHPERCALGQGRVSAPPCRHHSSQRHADALWRGHGRLRCARQGRVRPRAMPLPAAPRPQRHLVQHIPVPAPGLRVRAARGRQGRGEVARLEEGQRQQLLDHPQRLAVDVLAGLQRVRQADVQRGRREQPARLRLPGCPGSVCLLLLSNVLCRSHHGPRLLRPRPALCHASCPRRSHGPRRQGWRAHALGPGRDLALQRARVRVAHRAQVVHAAVKVGPQPHRVPELGQRLPQQRVALPQVARAGGQLLQDQSPVVEGLSVAWGCCQRSRVARSRSLQARAPRCCVGAVCRPCQV
mmetsp:Transcript_27639/g.70410  ORF Transcript_27639/g.70410 Transcript_27639/m.70410 type:complete len:386 (+) Transcript_27639:264-1421(+)